MEEFVERLIIEKEELSEKIKKLKSFVESDKIIEIDEIMGELLQYKLEIMLQYEEILLKRMNLLFPGESVKKYTTTEFEAIRFDGINYRRINLFCGDAIVNPELRNDDIEIKNNAGAIISAHVGDYIIKTDELYVIKKEIFEKEYILVK